MADSFITGDAGGTSTQWRVVSQGQIKQFETLGFNAYTHRFDDFRRSIEEVFGSEIEVGIPTYLYAAGIDNETMRAPVLQGLKEIFGENVSVENDLLGVARALCGKEPGYVGILGTGANACKYDGSEVNKVSASLGYVLGDEGSGAYMGKQLLASVFRSQLSKELLNAFQDKFDLSSHQAIDRIYNEPKPNHFLASFASFIHSNQSHPEIYQLIVNAFEDYFDAFFHYHSKEFPFHFSGSIAYFFSGILREVGQARGISIQNIVQSPIAGLVLYHQQYG